MLFNKRKLTRISCWLLAGILIFSTGISLGTTALASEHIPKISIPSADGVAGATIEIEINVANAAGNMAGGQLDLHYDPAIAVVTAVAPGKVLDNFMFIENTHEAAAGWVRMVWAAATATNTDGVLVRVTLQSKSPGTTTLEIKELKLTGEDGMPVISSAANGVLTVKDVDKPDRRDRDDDRAGAGGTTPPAADTAKDASKAVTDQLKKAQEGDTVAITAKKGETTLAVGGTALNQLAEKKAKLAVESKEAKATLEFDPQALLTDELKKAGKDALVEISAKMLQDQAAQAAADFADSIGGKKLQAYHFSVIVKEKPGAKTGTPVHQLNGEVTITLDVSDMLAEGANPALLAVFHKQPDGTWLERESTSDAKAKTLTFTTDSFSMFVVMEKPAVQNIIKLIIGQTIMMVDGKQQTMDVRPFIQTGTNRTMVPVRFVSEMLGAEVEWNEATRQVEIADGAKQIALTIGSKTVLVDGSKTTIDSAAEVLPPGRTFVPLRFISETLGAQVDYNDTTRQITITR